MDAPPKHSLDRCPPAGAGAKIPPQHPNPISDGRHQPHRQRGTLDQRRPGAGHDGQAEPRPAPLVHGPHKPEQEPGAAHQLHRLHQERPRIIDVDGTGQDQGQQEQPPGPRQAESRQQEVDRWQHQIETSRRYRARRHEMGQSRGPAEQHDTPFINRHLHQDGDPGFAQNRGLIEQ